MTDTNIFTVGGTVQAGHGLYIPRRADGELLRLCRGGNFAYVLTTRQLGKSSLMVRTAEHLTAEGVRSVIIDLSQIGVQVSAAEWYLGLLSMIEEQLSLNTDVITWWQERGHLGVTQRLTTFFEDVLLKEVTAPIVIFVDEIDTTLSLKFTDDFFAAIRYFYNARALSKDVQRLSFVLIGVATPGDLIRDPQRTPFNIGQRVDLTDFTLEEALPFAEGFGLPDEEARRLLGWVMKWTGGHPYLTQRLCRALTDDGRKEWLEADVDLLVGTTFFGKISEEDNNLQFVRDMLTKRAPNLSDVLYTYREVLRQTRPVQDEEQSLVKSHLKLSGVAHRRHGELSVRNPIYAEVFNDQWIKEHLPVNWYKRARRAGVPLAFALVLAAAVFFGFSAVAANRKIASANQKVVSAENLAKTLSARAEFARKEAEASLDEARTQRSIAEGSVLEAEKQKEQSQKALRMAEQQQRRAGEAVQRAKLSEMLAHEASRVADIRELNSAALASFDDDPQRGLILAAHAVKSSLGANDRVRSEAEQVLRRALLNSRELVTISENPYTVISLAFSPDGKRLAKGGGDNTWSIWDSLLDKRLVGQVDEDGWGLSFSPDGNILATGGKDSGTVKLWDSSTGQLLRTLENDKTYPSGHSSAVMDSTFSSDGRLLATGSTDNTAKIWDVASGKVLSTLRCDQEYGSVFSLAFSPDRKILATSCNGREAKLWEVNSGRLIRNFSQNTMYIAFSSDGLLATSNYGQVARLWNPSGELLEEFRGHEGDITAIAFSPDGTQLATGSQDNTVRIWPVLSTNSNPKSELFRLKGHTAQITSLAYSPDGKRLATASEDKTTRFWSLIPDQPGEFPSLRGHSGAVFDIAYSGNGKQMVTVGDDQTLRVWDADTGSQLLRLSSPDAISVSHNPRRHLVAVGTLEGTVQLWNANSGERLRCSARHEERINAIAFSPDGLQFATASTDGTAKVWDAESGQLKLSLANLLPESASFDKGEILALAYSPDGKRIITGNYGGIATVWDVVSGASMLTIGAGDPSRVGQQIRGVAFSPNGQLIATANMDTVIIWGASTGKRVMEFAQPRNPGRTTISQHLGIAFSPDGRRLVTVSGDKRARMWDVDSGALLATFAGHKEQVTGVAFSPDGNRVATAAGDGTVRIYAATAESLLQVARARITRRLTPEECESYLHSSTCPDLR